MHVPTHLRDPATGCSISASSCPRPFARPTAA